MRTSNELDHQTFVELKFTETELKKELPNIPWLLVCLSNILHFPHNKQRALHEFVCLITKYNVNNCSIIIHALKSVDLSVKRELSENEARDILIKSELFIEMNNIEDPYLFNTKLANSINKSYIKGLIRASEYIRDEEIIRIIAFEFGLKTMRTIVQKYGLEVFKDLAAKSKNKMLLAALTSYGMYT